ncbi:hypothetical protein LNV08_22325 [Paucibacter sp. TC2R-5]|uniref:hypothetical protein n=1 Tax=Paucibacter sp. TC2R-5 TaxID=2893555 RepID=UPI0021E35B71|nr:hypothetical protein [Paucibacter sp. TC2R-5]MCV2361707.1 hypothetical protein [Paucibacter sp. TC2R-5]
MLNRLPTPTQCPALSQMLDNIGNPSPKALAKALGVCISDMQTWIETDCAPRPVLLALFWLTVWAQSSVDAESINISRLHVSIAVSLRTELAGIKHELARILTHGNFGAATRTGLADGSPEFKNVSITMSIALQRH